MTNQYWAEAIATAAYLRNRAPTSVIKEGKTPYERWYGKRPCISHLKVFGCIAYAHIPSIHRQNWIGNHKSFALLATVKSRKATDYWMKGQ